MKSQNEKTKIVDIRHKLRFPLLNPNFSLSTHFLWPCNAIPCPPHCPAPAFRSLPRLYFSPLAMASAFHHNYHFTPILRHRTPPSTPPILLRPNNSLSLTYRFVNKQCSCSRITCKATEMSSMSEESAASGIGGENWVPVVPLAALPKGERRVIIQDGETILLLWYKDEVFATENRSPAEGAYTEGLLNAKLTQVFFSPNCLSHLLITCVIFISMPLKLEVSLWEFKCFQNFG